MLLVLGLWTLLRAVLFGAAAIALETVALRHQLAVLQRAGRRPRLSGAREALAGLPDRDQATRS